ncbi:MAG TPA: methanol/ethanol family PQQ-dependent dehydrogenase [Polyangiaceae bacterium]|nr:methanol/ethanol family PQQ-dependent dehydrogenase [Polyangiaceae bacterium]
MRVIRRAVSFVALGLFVANVGCHGHTDTTASTAPARPIGPIAEPARPLADDGQWRMAAKDHANLRYSTLSEIDTGSVGSLRVAWTFSTGVLRGHEAPPLVVDNVMYVVTPFPNYLYALDLAKPGAPVEWKYDPGASPSAQGVACCDVVNRGAAYDDGRIYYNALDGQTIAVDASNGKEIWRAQLGNINKGETMTMAPLVIRGRVLVGNSGGEMGVRGWIAALEGRTGKIAWRAYSTGPDSDVLIGPSFRPFYAQNRGKDLGVQSWPPDKWKIGGGNAWGWLSYDPDLDLVYYGTGNPSPWNGAVRAGDNLWTSGIFARRPDTGEAIWFYQWTPHDQWDYDGINESLVLDVPWQGTRRKALLHADRNGYVYLLDRATGEVLSAETFVDVNTSKGVDLKTGRPIAAPEKEHAMGHVTRGQCPSASGGKDWQPSAFSPKTGLVYIPLQNLCSDEEPVEANYIAGTPYVGAHVRMYPAPNQRRGGLAAWDPVNARKVWSLAEEFPVWSGVLATEGGVVFYGTMDGWFKAVDARDGKQLWQFKVPSGIVGQPMTYRGPDGKQYVAIFSGVGGWAGAIVAGDLDPRDSSAALGFVGAMSDLPGKTTKGGTLFVFSP